VKKTFGIFLLFSVASNVYAAKTIDSKDRIKTVTVFKNRAYVKRVGKVIAGAGSYSIYFDKVTPILDTQSLKVVIPKKGAAEVLGIRHKKIYLKKNKNSDLQKFLNEKIDLYKTRRKIINTVQSLLKQDSDLGLLRRHYDDSFTLNLHTKKWSSANFKNFLKLLEDRARIMHGKWKSAYKKYLKNHERLQFVSNKISQLGSVSGKESYTIFVDVSIPKRPEGEKSEFAIELQYLVHNAGWSPTYDIRIDSKNEKALIEQHAIIHQNTGEDWKNVKLTLSNVRTELRPKLPTINSYTLSYREVKKVKTTIKSKIDDVKQLLLGEDNLQSGSIKGIAKNFKIKARQTLRDGMPKTKIFVQKVNVPYKEHLEVVATQFEKVYKKGKLKNGFSFTMTPGRASIYYNGDFVQNFWLDSVPKKAPFYINAGNDYNVLVNRWYSSKIEKKGIINKDKIYKRVYHTKFRNFSNRKKKIKVLDQIPKSEVKAIQVSYQGSTKGLRDLLKHPSWIFWDITIPANGFKEVELKLAVTTPDDFQFTWKD